MHKAYRTISTIERSEIAWACLSFIFAIAFAVGLAVIADDSGASSSTTGALVLRTEPASSLVASRFDHLAKGNPQ